MTHRPVARTRSTEDAVPRIAVVKLGREALADSGFTTLLESAAQQILAVTYWFDPVPGPRPYAVTVRFSGHRVDVKGRLSPGGRVVI